MEHSKMDKWFDTEVIAWSMVVVFGCILAGLTVRTVNETRTEIEARQLAAVDQEASNVTHEWWANRHREIRKEIDCKDEQIADLESENVRLGELLIQHGVTPPATFCRTPLD